MHKLQAIGNALATGIRKQKKVVALLALGVVLGGAGTALVGAAIPDADGKIHACYSTGMLGRVRIIDSPSQTCRSGETAISWDQSAGSGGGAAGGFISNNLPDSTFRMASLQYRDLKNITFSGSEWVGSDLTGSHLTGSSFTGNTFKPGPDAHDYMNLAGVVAAGVNFSSSYFEFNFRAPGANFSGANFTNATFEGGLDGAGVSATDFTDANFQNANFTGTIFKPYPGAPNFGPPWNQFKGGDFSGAQFVDANLNGVMFTGSSFVSAIWDNTVCPDGSNSDSHGNTCVGFGL